MTLIRSGLAVSIILSFAQIAFAGTINVRINNVSGKTISAIFATPKGEAAVSVTNVFQGGQLTVTNANGACVYTLSVKFSDNTTLDRPDVDLCQTETLMVE